MDSRVFSAMMIVGLAVCLVTPDAFAMKTWEAGVKLGGQGAKLTGNQVGLYLTDPPAINVAGPVGDKSLGFVGGGFVRRNFNDMFGLQLEVLYSQKGGKGGVAGTVEYLAENNEYYTGVVDGELTASIDYIEIPALAVFSFEADERVELVAELGVSFAFNSSAEMQLKGKVSFDQPSFTKIIEHFDQTTKIGGHVNDFDFGGVVGGGVEVEAGNVILHFDARLTFGLTSIDKISDRTVRNQVISVFAGVGIPFGSEM